MLVLVAAAASCDTGDGKQLAPPTNTLDPATATVEDATTDTGATGATVATLPSIDAPAATTELPADGGTVALPTDEPGGEFAMVLPWLDGASIDRRHTCDGEDVSPAVSWVAPPEGTVELALVVEDLDAERGGLAFVHWAIAGLDPSTVTLVEGQTPPGAVQALNFAGDVGWTGPCPEPGGDPHTYRFRLHALNQQVELADGTPASDLLGVIDDLTIEMVEATGTYGR